MVRLENEDLKTPIHLHELRYHTIEEDVFVDAEPESINGNTFHFDRDSLRCVTLSAQCFYDKGGRFLARNITRLPNVSMIDSLLCMIFSPNVEIELSPKKDFYSAIILEKSKSNKFKLTHQITTQDINDINGLRASINQTLCTHEGMALGHRSETNTNVYRILCKE